MLRHNPARAFFFKQSCLCSTPHKELFMGFLFNANTWRAPLRLIDSWLPPTQASRQRHPASVLASTFSSNRTLQRFARAGWLAAMPPTAPEPSHGHSASGHATFRSVPAPRAEAPAQARRTPRSLTRRSHGHAQFAISGRMSDVCAELDRLAALEHGLQTHGQH